MCLNLNFEIWFENGEVKFEFYLVFELIVFRLEFAVMARTKNPEF